MYGCDTVADFHNGADIVELYLGVIVLYLLLDNRADFFRAQLHGLTNFPLRNNCRNVLFQVFQAGLDRCVDLVVLHPDNHAAQNGRVHLVG
jgi:hypothetical protein